MREKLATLLEPAGRARAMSRVARVDDAPARTPFGSAFPRSSSRGPGRASSRDVHEGLGPYLDQLSRIPILGPEEQLSEGRKLEESRRRLSASVVETEDDGDARREWIAQYDGARQALVRSHLRMVVLIARRYAHRGVPLIDLIQEGNVGLMKAAGLFDPTRGFRFSTYAKWWVREAISSALAAQGGPWNLPVHVILALAKVRESTHRLAHRLQRPPAPEEIAAEAGVTAGEVRRVLSAGRGAVSLDQPLAMDQGDRLGDLLRDPAAGESPSSDTQKTLECRIRGALATLEPKARRVVELRFGIGGGRFHSRRETGRLVGLSHERIRQIEVAALGRLRDPMRAGAALAPLL